MIMSVPPGEGIQALAGGNDLTGIIAQGWEAGGHVRGTVTSLVLLPQVVQAVSVPVIASGGFASGESLIAAFALGAQAIHCGTAFLATEESFAHTYHKDRVARATSDDTVYTDAFAVNWPPHSPVRVIANSLTDELGQRLLGHKPQDIPREAIAKEDGRPIYRYSTDSPLRITTGDLECLALFAGQIAGAIETIPSAGTRVGEIVSEAVPSENLIRWIRRRKENRIMIEADGDLLQTFARIYVGLLSFA